MTPESTRAQPAEAINDLVRAAAARKQPVAAVYDGFPRLLCPHLLGRSKEGRLRTFCHQFGGGSGSGLRMAPVGGERCIAVDKLSEVELRGRLAHRSTLRPAKLHRGSRVRCRRSGWRQPAKRAVRQLPQQEARQNDA